MLFLYCKLFNLCFRNNFLRKFLFYRELIQNENQSRIGDMCSLFLVKFCTIQLNFFNRNYIN